MARAKVMVYDATPAAMGFCHRAEWEPHEATWIGWPRNRTDWPGKFAPIPWVYAEIVRALARGEKVRILIDGAAAENRARRVLGAAHADLAAVEFFRFPTDRGWCRDMGPIFVSRRRPRREHAIVRFAFNAWAKYRNWRKDVLVAEAAAAALGVSMFEARYKDRAIVLEGGAIDVNGRGTVLTTEECLLDQEVQARNPGLGRNDVETILAEYLGARNVIWLGRGIAGDDTHGHVDDIARFVGPRTVVIAQERDPKEANYRPLAENRERLAGARLEDGSKLEVVALPMPAPLYFAGQRLPVSYANFYIANAAVLVPTFNDPNDRIALGTLAELFEDRPVVGIHAVDLVLGLGTLHCLTHEQPA